jgi:RHS repeat-associated protein
MRCSGIKPVLQQSFGYSDDYRLTSVDLTYAGSASDVFVSPYRAEQLAGDQTYPPVQAPSTGRIRKPTFAYDWLGNTTATSDDAKDFVDRSLGTIANGSATAGRNQLRSAIISLPTSLGTVYDAAGNMTAWGVRQTGRVIRLEAQYRYTWDEVGRLASASRRDSSQQTTIDTQFLYLVGGRRVISVRQDSNMTAPEYTINVFDSLALQKTSVPDAAGTDYVRNSATEQVYLGAGKTALAHVFSAQQTLPTGADGPIHVFFQVGDPLGSTSFVIDKDTSELVERATYQTYGSVESDYRPARWQSFRADIRYTGHWDNAEVGLVYFGARYFAPQLGRWISPDPLTIHSLAGDLNPYAFVGA